MIQKGTVLTVADNSGARLVKVYHVGASTKCRYATIGDKVSGSVIEAIPKGKVKKGDKVRLVIVRAKRNFLRSDGSHIRFDDNAGVIIDDSNNPIGNRIFGPVAMELGEEFGKIVSNAEYVI